MILSDRVSGTLPIWGLVAAAVAIVSLPGWSLAQKPAEMTVACLTEQHNSVQQGSASTAARLEQIESELKRVSRMLEEAKRSSVDRDRRDRPRHERCRDGRLPGTFGDRQTFDRHLLPGRSQDVLSRTDEEKTYLRAFDQEDQGSGGELHSPLAARSSGW